MGLLSRGDSLQWCELRAWCRHVRRHGARQFAAMYRAGTRRRGWGRGPGGGGDPLRWGDEIEYTLVWYDHGARRVRLLLVAGDLLGHCLTDGNDNNHPGDFAQYSIWHPEYGDYMLEGIPAQPYGHALAYINTVEANMQLRRARVRSLLNTDCESIVTLTGFPRLGCQPFWYPQREEEEAALPVPTTHSNVTGSQLYPDECICKVNPKFEAVSRHMRERAGHQQCIWVPIFRDARTPRPYVDEAGARHAGGTACPHDHIYADCLGFGGGSCCLQVTFQAHDVEEAKLLYDQLTPVCAVMMALSACTPIFRGYLADIDHRWHIFKQAADCRTEREKAEGTYTGSRCETVFCYLSERAQRYNDIEVTFDREVYDLMSECIDDPGLCKHVAHVLQWDPLFLQTGEIYQDDERDNEHFENVQSSYWQSVRFKPPPPPQNEHTSTTDHIGWRVEFRPLDLQITDFENAALCAFTHLLTRAIISFGLDLLIPISKVVYNMEVAVSRDAVNTGKLWFRKGRYMGGERSPDIGEDCCLMSVDEIMNGSLDIFPGLIPLVRRYLDSVEDIDVDTRYSIEAYLTLLGRRASGQVPTGAHWMRTFVSEHAAYRRDSAVTEEIAYDLVKTIDVLGHRQCAAVDVDRNEDDDGLYAKYYRQLTGGLRSNSKVIVAQSGVSSGSEAHIAAINHVQSCLF